MYGGFNTKPGDYLQHPISIRQLLKIASPPGSMSIAKTQLKY
jgi:hypothetical protein